MSSAKIDTTSATIWISRGDEKSWTPTELGGATFVLVVGEEVAVRPLDVSTVGTIGASSAILARFAGDLREEWCVLGSPAVRINGEALVLGVRLLENRDEICFAGGARVYFSTERAAHPERFPGADRRVVCPCCSCELVAGDLCVRCPQPSCRLVHHHSEDERDSCWLAAPTCAGDGCRQKTAFDAGDCWTPED